MTDSPFHDAMVEVRHAFVSRGMEPPTGLIIRHDVMIQVKREASGKMLWQTLVRCDFGPVYNGVLLTTTGPEDAYRRGILTGMSNAVDKLRRYQDQLVAGDLHGEKA